MSRRRRVSRALIGVLSITIALGLVFWLHNLTKSKAAPTGTAHVDVHTPPPPPSASVTAAAAAAKPAEAGSPTRAIALGAIVGVTVGVTVVLSAAVGV